MLSLELLNIYVPRALLQEELGTSLPYSDSKEPRDSTQDERKGKEVLNDLMTNVDEIVLNRGLDPDFDEVTHFQLYKVCYLTPCIYLQ